MRNKTIPQSKFVKLSMKQKFKRYFLLALGLQTKFDTQLPLKI